MKIKTEKKKISGAYNNFAFLIVQFSPVMIIAQYNGKKLTLYRLILTTNENNFLIFDNLKAFQHFS